MCQGEVARTLERDMDTDPRMTQQWQGVPRQRTGPGPWPPDVAPQGHPTARESKARWIAGLVISGVLLPVIVFFLIRDGGPLNPKEPAALGGAITSVDTTQLNPCCSFSVNFTLEGFKGQTATIEAVVTEYYSGNSAPPVPVISAVPEADKDNAAFPVDLSFAGYPTGDYYVTFVLYAPNGTELDRMDSEVITLY